MCVDESHACSSCGYDLGDQIPRVLLREAEARDQWWRRFVPEPGAFSYLYDRKHWNYLLIVGSFTLVCVLSVVWYLQTR
jgi:hypothetical protein